MSKEDLYLIEQNKKDVENAIAEFDKHSAKFDKTIRRILRNL